MQHSNLLTFHLGLIGYPLSHSLSPRIHTAALQACGLKGSYSLFLIPPEDHESLKGMLSQLRSGEIHGLNVTIPHKQNVIPFLDNMTSTAQTIGAVNTIYCRDSKLIGDNTDAAGFLKDLNSFLSIHPSNIEDRRSALVLGAGGSARAVVYALVNDGWQVTIAARRLDQSQQLASSFDGASTTEFNLQSFQLSDLQLIINTTPVGMTPNNDQSPWPENVPFPPHAALYDLVYNPAETKLVRDARQQGLPASTGLGMLIEQAALSFEIWTGYKPTREVMVEAVRQTAY